MRGFQAVSLKVAEHIPLRTAFCRFYDNDYNEIIKQGVNSAHMLEKKKYNEIFENGELGNGKMQKAIKRNNLQV